MKRMTCTEAKRIDMVDYLMHLGYHPAKIIGDDHWYHSPLRDEATPSFKVNRKLGVWYDHGLGAGGDLIDFGVQYHRCGVADFLRMLDGNKERLSFHQPVHPAAAGSTAFPAAGERKITRGRGIHVVEVRTLENPALLDYLEERGISPAISKSHCGEVDFLLNGKQLTAIGFPNGRGGHELRSRDFKGSSPPKAPTLIGTGTGDLAVFEGFTDFLSFLELNRNLSAPPSDCLVLNSLAFLEKSRPLVERYGRVYLVLDRDGAGRLATAKAVARDGGKYLDSSGSYRGYKDLNDYLRERKRQTENPRQDQHLKRGIRR